MVEWAGDAFANWNATLAALTVVFRAGILSVLEDEVLGGLGANLNGLGEEGALGHEPVVE